MGVSVANGWGDPKNQHATRLKNDEGRMENIHPPFVH